MKKYQKIGISLAVVTAVSFSGCGTEEDSESLYPATPTIEVSKLDISDSGAEMTWYVKVNNLHPSANIRINPYNDSTYTYSGPFVSEYNANIQLDCNSEVGNNGEIKCNDITAISCTRVLMGSEYSEFTCDYHIGENYAAVPQYETKMRVPTMTNGTPEQQTLLNVGTKYWYESGGNERIGWIYNNDTEKMYNVYTNGMGGL